MEFRGRMAKVTYPLISYYGGYLHGLQSPASSKGEGEKMMVMMRVMMKMKVMMKMMRTVMMKMRVEEREGRRRRST